SGSWISTADSVDFTLGSSAFEFDCWIKPASGVDSTLLYIAGQMDSGLAATAGAWVLSRTAANKLELKITDGVSFTTDTGATANLTNAYGWRHVAFSRLGSVSTLSLDGVPDATATFTAAVFDSANNLRICAGGEVTTTPWNGFIDLVRLSIGTNRVYNLTF